MGLGVLVTALRSMWDTYLNEGRGEEGPRPLVDLPRHPASGFCDAAVEGIVAEDLLYHPQTGTWTQPWGMSRKEFNVTVGCRTGQVLVTEKECTDQPAAIDCHWTQAAAFRDRAILETPIDLCRGTPGECLSLGAAALGDTIATAALFHQLCDED